MNIDAHQHFWRYSETEYPWIPKGSALHRDWLPADLAAVASPVGIDGSVVVQARETIEESRWLLQLADESPFIKGVVGWVDLRSENVGEDLAALSKNKKFLGVRHVVQSQSADFMLEPDFLRGIRQLHTFGFTYDLLLFPKHLPSAVKVAEKFPDQRFVLDHIAKPMIRAGMMQPWQKDLVEFAKNPNVSCKISGMITEAKMPGWKAEDFHPYLDAVLAAFGEDRVMFGSDWPVCLLGGSYAQVHGLVADYFEQFSEDTRRKFFGETAAKVYRL